MGNRCAAAIINNIANIRILFSWGKINDCKELGVFSLGNGQNSMLLPIVTCIDSNLPNS
jgi:hypothetical protein